MRHTLSFLALAALFCRPAAAEVLKASSFTLSNGLEVVVVENHRAPVVTHMVWYKTGGINDPLGKSGLAHMLEHMMFKGTAEVPDGEFSQIIARNGGQENAFTAADYTAYYQNIARDRLELVMFLESDRMRSLRLREQDFAPELEVVKEERLMRYDNNPAMILSERRNRTLWGDHPYGRPVIGTRRELASLEMKDAARFYETYYAPDNAVLVVAGDITPEELRPLAEKYYGRVPPGRTPREKKQFTGSYPVRARLEMRHPMVNIRTVSRTYVVPSYVTDRQKAYAYDILAEALGASHVGRLYRQFVLRDKSAGEVGAFYDGFTLDKGTFTIYAVLADGTTPEKFERDMDSFLSSVRLTDDDIEKAKVRLAAGMDYIADDPENAANLVGKLRVLGLSVDEIQNRTKNIGRTTAGEVRAALAEMTASPASVTGWLLPEEKTK